MEEKSASRSPTEKQQLIQLIVFRIGGEEFGVPIGAVQEIIKVGNVTPIPDSPDFIKGLINVRGEIVAIIDVRARFSLTEQKETPRHIVIAKQNEALFGLMVDEVMEVLRVQESDIKPRPKLMTKLHEEYVQGVITHEGRLIMLLDVQLVFSEDELIRLAEMTRHKHENEYLMKIDESLDKTSEDRISELNVVNKMTARSKKKKHDQ